MNYSYITTQKNLSVPIHTTCVCKTVLEGVKFDESQLTSLPKTENVIRIKSNYYDSDGTCAKPKKTYRKNRRGTRDAFDSMIEFTVVNSSKEYKIKVFRNGKCIVPGANSSDLSDIHDPLTILCKYMYDHGITKTLSSYGSLESITHNYKMFASFKLNPTKVMTILDTYQCRTLTFPLVRLEAYLTAPIIGGKRVSWQSIIMSGESIKDIDVDSIINSIIPWDINIRKKVDIQEHRLFSTGEKNLISLADMPELIATYNDTIHALRNVMIVTQTDFTPEDIEYIMGLQIKKFINNVFIRMSQAPNVNYYINDNMTKVTVSFSNLSIVFYSSGKINAHGIRNATMLIRVYKWVLSVIQLYLHDFGKGIERDICDGEDDELD